MNEEALGALGRMVRFALYQAGLINEEMIYKDERTIKAALLSAEALAKTETSQAEHSGADVVCGCDKYECPNPHNVRQSPKDGAIEELLEGLRAAYDTLDAIAVAGNVHLVSAGLPEGHGMDTFAALLAKHGKDGEV